ncbi:hypothetical protein FSP39_023743 [Pinctada imbricata]|uniref:Uncharacterized protein n=1 Tax=Pinctada imbricata TaxID=66713 RepID=A0AA88Y623_PINIB|nr:hypothetical protein FSP39_023743 [Pinctada imbricata]
MNERYKLLVDFLQKAATDEETASEFITGEATPFNTQLDMDDKLFKFLITPNESIDKIAIPLIQNLFQSISDLCRMVSDHLPGGRYWNPTVEVIADTKSVMKHNKLPEFVFGQLDQLLRYRPNATLLTNESFIIYSHNMTRQWFDSLSEDAKDKLIEEARKEGNSRGASGDPHAPP